MEALLCSEAVLRKYDEGLGFRMNYVCILESALVLAFDLYSVGCLVSHEHAMIYTF